MYTRIWIKKPEKKKKEKCARCVARMDKQQVPSVIVEYTIEYKKEEKRNLLHIMVIISSFFFCQ